jgi:ADP-ribose pyrophosphatase
MPLPALPSIELRVVQDQSAPAGAGFLRLRRRLLRACYPDGSGSEPFSYDCVERTALDAVVVAAHYLGAGAQRFVYLRSALRPPVGLRPMDCRPWPEKSPLGVLWELPAGLVEPDECSREGLARCAARELGEELGFELPPEALRPLGPSTFPAPALIGERHHYFHVVVSPEQRMRPSEDGSVLERDAAVLALPLEEALTLVRHGQIEDAKTELGLRRLTEI